MKNIPKIKNLLIRFYNYFLIKKVGIKKIETYNKILLYEVCRTVLSRLSLLETTLDFKEKL